MRRRRVLHSPEQPCSYLTYDRNGEFSIAFNMAAGIQAPRLIWADRSVSSANRMENANPTSKSGRIGIDKSRSDSFRNQKSRTGNAPIYDERPRGRRPHASDLSPVGPAQEERRKSSTGHP